MKNGTLMCRLFYCNVQTTNVFAGLNVLQR